MPPLQLKLSPRAGRTQKNSARAVRQGRCERAASCREAGTLGRAQDLT